MAVVLLLAAAAIPGVPAAAAAPGSVLYRVNAGGPAISGAPDWRSDSPDAPSSFVNVGAIGNNTYSTSSPIDTSDPSLPAGAPAELFQTERWDPTPAPEMTWTFPVSPGAYEVRMYFAEIFSGAMNVGSRVFDVSIEGALVLDNFDVYAAAGGNKGIMRSFVVGSDDTLTIDFAHVAENPAIKGIEILTAPASANTLGVAPASIAFGSTTVGQSTSRSITLTNFGGSGDPSITVTSTTINGLGSSQFSDTFDDANGVTLAPGASASFNVSFAPTSAGTKSATLDIAHSGVNTPISIPLSGAGTPGGPPVGFGKGSLAGTNPGLTLKNPTSLQFGPDGRLYVAMQSGVIKAYTVIRNSPNAYGVTATETINTISTVPNRNDDGTLNPAVTGRLVTGILVTGTAGQPVIYVTHSDPRIGGGSGGTDTNLDTNSTMISRLTKVGASWQKLDLVRGLPRAEENHTANGMQLDAVTNILYVAMGGNTNKGAPSHNFAFLPEFALSAAILSVDLGAIGNTTYDLPTLDDDARPGNPDTNDPFGGDNGKNQAKVVPGGPVQVYAPGFRNPYDLVIHSSRRMYTIDNGANAGWGDVPVGEGPSGTCTNEVSEPGTSDPDALFLITGPGSYGGHPNPTRGNKANTFNADGQSPVSTANPVECDYLDPVSAGLTEFPTSTNGLVEYTASDFGGSLKGDLLAAGLDNAVYRLKLDDTGTQVVLKEQLFATIGQYPLDVTAVGDTGPLHGTVWVADYGTSQIYAFEPNDFGGGGGSCGGDYDRTIDDDGDLYSNADEIDNGTNPCSAASVPPDHDGDHISDLNDPDDDNDGVPDTSDPFAWDAADGRTTSLPVSYSWDNDAPNPGGLLGLGFTGLMTNGQADYRTLYDASQMTAGGAAGVTTVDSVPSGDAFDGQNDQQYGFQFGVKADPATTGVFTAHTRINAPFAGQVPHDFQSMGMYVGTGTQDDYLKIVVSATGGAGGIEVLKEFAGAPTHVSQTAVPMPGPDGVDLYLTVDPAAATVQPSYRVTSSGTPGPIVSASSPVPVPASWFGGSRGLAVGIISTSNGGAPAFPATWDFIEVLPRTAGGTSTYALDRFTRTVSAGWGTGESGGPWSVVAGAAANFSVAGSKGVISAPAGGAQQIAALPGVSARDVDTTLLVGFPGGAPAAGEVAGDLVVRRQAAGAFYRVGLVVFPGGALKIRGQTDAGATLFPDVTTGLNVSPGDTFALRVLTQGNSPTTIRARAWRAGAAQPTGWAATGTDSTAALQAAGGVGLRGVDTGAGAADVQFDDLLATSVSAGLSPQGGFLGVSPASVSFPATVVGQTATRQVTVTNLGQPGDPAITISGTTETGTDPSQFSDTFNDAAGATLAPGASTSFNVSFAPTATGARSASLSITHTGINTPLGVALSGTGKPPPPGTWQTRAPSSFNRQEVSYVYDTVDGKFYLAGGSTKQEAYDPATNTWTTVAPLPQSLDHIQSIEVNGKIYYLGGLITWPSPASNTLYIYDPKTNTFSQGAKMPRPRGAGGVAVYQGKIYYAGGLSNGNAVAWFDVYDPNANTWTQLPDMPHARDHFHAAVVNGKFWAIGGRLAAISATVTYNEAFSFATGQWQTGFAPLPTPRGGFAVAVLGDEIAVIGGEVNSATQSTNEAYNTVTNTWRTFLSMPTSRHGIEAAVCNGGVYIVAGGTTPGGSNPTNVHEVFFLGSPTTCVPPPAPGTTVARDSFTRSRSNGWGSADVGGAWSVAGGAASNFSVDGSRGAIQTPGQGAQQLAILGGVSLTDVDLSLKVTIPRVVASGVLFDSVVARRQSSGAHYRVGVFLGQSGKLQIRGQTDTGAALFPDVSTGLTVAPGDTFVLRVQFQGTFPTTIRAKAWRSTAAEPAAWSVIANDYTLALQLGGTIGIRAVNTTNLAAKMTFDDLLAKTL